MATRDIALVTGAAKGIGFAIANRLVDDGMTVILTDIDEMETKQAANRLGEHAHGYALNVTSPEQWGTVVEAVTAELGPITVLVHNAGITGASVPFTDVTLENWQNVLDVNLNGVFHGCKVVVPGMIEAGYGRIVNIASIAGKQGFPASSPYVASKHAVAGFTKSLALDLATTGIAVNAVTPGVIETDILKGSDPEALEAVKQSTPVGSIGKPEDVANLVSYLASRQLGFTTGALFDISGGVSDY